MFDFFHKTNGAGIEEKASAVGPLMAGSMVTSGRVAALRAVNRTSWTARDTVSLTRAGFLGNPMGFRVVRLISEAAAALPLVLQDCERRFDQHPVLSLMRRPNPAQGKAEFLEAVFAQLLLSGNAYLEAVQASDAEPGALPVELHVLRADRISVVPGPDGWPAAYDYAVGGRKHRFSMGGDARTAPICHIRGYHPADDHYGLSPLEAAATAIDVHNSASRWSKALLDNAARPSGAIVYNGSDGQSRLSAEQFERLQAEMETHHQGARNAGRPMLLEGGLDWKPMGFSPSDMEFHKTKEAAAREIAIAFGVPPMLLGIPGDATYANRLAAGADEADLYALAVDVLAELHARPAAAQIACPGYDLDTHLAELAIFCDWFVPALAPGLDAAAFAADFLGLWQDALAPVAGRHETLVLRDFHMDNLMVLDDRPGIRRCGLLDFQDAVRGPSEYDLVSLLQDARRDLSAGLEARMLARYVARAPGHLGAPDDIARRYALLGAQRHARILGVFVRLCLRDGKPGYLRWIPRVLRQFGTAMADAGLQDVAGLLDRALPDWRNRGERRAAELAAHRPATPRQTA